jgi:hypothetical protein
MPFGPGLPWPSVPLSWCRFHKLSTHVTYSENKISWRVLKIMDSIGGAAYFALAVSYERKMFMTLTAGEMPSSSFARVSPPGVNDIKLFSFIIDNMA